ncbi:MAG: hypothetical protein FJX77_13650, partial [Armatimonadetes bacterium]|nr:hypothetical protein [Armatimonadota bacterium]
MADTSLPELNALWDFQDPALSEVRFRELLSCAGVREDRGYLACLLTQLARSVGLQQRFEEARELLDQAEEVAPPEDGLARTRLLLERGRVANSSGDRAGSRPYFLAAWETAESAGLESLAVDAAHMLGIVEEPEQAMEWNYRAMERAEKSSDPAVRNWLGPLYNNTGWTRFERGELEAALVLFERGLVLREARGQPRETRIARWSVARVWRALGRVEPALAEQHALADACDA